MLGATLAIGDFMLMLLSAIFWVGMGFVGWAALAVAVLGGAVLAAGRWRARRRR